MENETNALYDIIQSLSQNLSTNTDNLKTEYVEQTNKNTSQDLNILDILNNLGITNSSSENTPKDTSNTFDISTIVKMQKLLSAFNSEDPRKNLLMGIKPFLRSSRQNKINEYIAYFSVISALGIFGNNKG
ncbi:MAG: hypothetical protein IJ809_00830 [Clostridia bacterium]|nr:hypothetical protein [Clostridia bacterium]